MMYQNTQRQAFVAVLLLLLGAGWAANHFASMLGPLREQENFNGVLVSGAYGIYALGLLPSLLAGGSLLDRIGARKVVLTGGAIAALGNVILSFWHGEIGLFGGRFIVGLGVGLVTSAGTVWAGKLRPAGGITLAGIFLTLGFASGPIVSGVLVYVLSTGAALPVSFAVSAIVSLITVLLALLSGNVAEKPSQNHLTSAAPAQSADKSSQQSIVRALSAALPMAIWVFSCSTTVFVVLSVRVADSFIDRTLLPGFAAFLSYGAGLGVQMLGRRFGWGPRAGISAALLAAVGMVLAGAGGGTPPLWLFIIACLFLGAAYGLCLQQGLIDIENLAPSRVHGTVTGTFYVFAYLGFGLPVLLESLFPIVGVITPFSVLAILALFSALVRCLQIAKTYLFSH